MLNVEEGGVLGITQQLNNVNMFGPTTTHNPLHYCSSNDNNFLFKNTINTTTTTINTTSTSIVHTHHQNNNNNLIHNHTNSNRCIACDEQPVAEEAVSSSLENSINVNLKQEFQQVNPFSITTTTNNNNNFVKQTNNEDDKRPDFYDDMFS